MQMNGLQHPVLATKPHCLWRWGFLLKITMNFDKPFLDYDKRIKLLGDRYGLITKERF